MDKIDELCDELGKLADVESKELPDNKLCNESFSGFDCTRPEGHSGFHISLGVHPFVYVMWHNDLSD